VRFFFVFFLFPFCSFGQKADSIIARLPKRTPFIENFTKKDVPIYILNDIVFRVNSDNITQKPKRIGCIGSMRESNKPLYIVNGIPVDKKTLGNLKVNNIKSIEVLKEPFATAVYGTNGVILITTKEHSKKKRNRQKKQKSS